MVYGRNAVRVNYWMVYCSICIMNIQPTDGTGVTSCLSVRLSDACAYARENGLYPDGIDSSKQFWLYKEDKEHDIQHYFLSSYVQPPSAFNSGYHHEWQWNWYNDIEYQLTAKLSSMICPVSDEVKRRAQAHKHIIQGRMYVLYRGNDKAQEIESCPYQVMVDMAKASGHGKFFVQTDDADFLVYFLKRFEDVTWSDATPRIRSNSTKYVMPLTGKAEFAQSFLSLLYASQYADGLITTTGNTGIWAALFRGTLENTYQHNGRQGEWKKVG